MDLTKFTDKGKFLMLAVDHRNSFRKLINPADPKSVSREQIIELKSKIISSVENQITGLTLDADFGLPAYQRKSKPYIMPLEKADYLDNQGERITELEFDATQIRELGASGALLLIYTNPELESFIQQMETARQAMQDCKTHGFPYFLEIVSYTPDVQLQSHIGSENLLVESVKKFIEEGIIPDVWKLEYPGSKEACGQVTQLVGEVPWLLLSGGDHFETFKEHLKEAIEAGASGFLTGRALWQEGLTLQGEEREKFFSETLPARFKELVEIVKS